MARKAGATDIINFAEEDVYERIKEISKGEGADVVIDCVGMEASPGHGQGGLVSAVKEKVMPAERTYVLDQAIRAVRPCGVVCHARGPSWGLRDPAGARVQPKLVLWGSPGATSGAR
jgi:threonine dehydrogenase-like Zn-dependent dehydrogenase